MANDQQGSDDGTDDRVGRGQEELVYESNPKHRDPWQTGKKGSLCEPDVRPHAERLLQDSIVWDEQRYAIYEGKAFCAQEHLPRRWHGYPVGWKEVPAKLVRRLIEEGRLTKRDRKKYWETH
jgi:hypothetical protein